MASGPVLGFSTQPRTVQKEKHDMQLHTHKKTTSSKIKEALQVNSATKNNEQTVDSKDRKIIEDAISVLHAPIFFFFGGGGSFLMFDNFRTVFYWCHVHFSTIVNPVSPTSFVVDNL